MFVAMPRSGKQTPSSFLAPNTAARKMEDIVLITLFPKLLCFLRTTLICPSRFPADVDHDFDHSIGKSHPAVNTLGRAVRCVSYHAIVAPQPLLKPGGTRRSRTTAAPASCRARAAAGRPAWSRPRRSRPESRSARAIRSHQIANRDLPPGAQVDRLRAVVALGRQHDPLRRVLDVEELPRGGARAPDLDRRPRPRSRASTHFLISAGMTWELSGSKLSPGP